MYASAAATQQSAFAATAPSAMAPAPAAAVSAGQQPSSAAGVALHAQPFEVQQPARRAAPFDARPVPAAMRPSSGLVQSGSATMGIDASTDAGFGLSLPSAYCGAKRWDYKSRTHAEQNPFELPQTHLDTVWRRQPQAQLSRAFKPYNTDASATLAPYRSNWPSDSFSFSRVDVLPAPELARRTAFARDTASKSKLFGPQAAAEQSKAQAAARGRDPTDVPTGFRLVERSGAPTYSNVKVARIDVPFGEQALVKQFAAERAKADEKWKAEVQARAAQQQANAAATGDVTAAAPAEVEDPALRIVRQRAFPRPPQPHPMYLSTNGAYGQDADSDLAKHYVYFPRKHKFTDSAMLRE